jgi:chitinase
MNQGTFFFTLLCTTILSIPSLFAQVAKSPFEVVGYLPDYRINSVKADQLKGLTDLIYFSIEPSADGSLPEEPISKANLEKIVQFQRDLGCRVLISIGGWGKSTNFPALAASGTSRRRFIDGVKNYCLTHGFAGIDLDWEHPKGEEELQNLTVLVAEAWKDFEPSALVITVAQASWQDLGKGVYKNVERVHLMSYDHAFPQATPSKSEADVERLLGYGCPGRKIVLGVPFYGRDKDRQALPYREIIAGQVPGAAVDEIKGYAFNGRKTIGEKMDFVAEKALGGIMIWEVGQDSRDPATSLL